MREISCSCTVARRRLAASTISRDHERRVRKRKSNASGKSFRRSDGEVVRPSTGSSKIDRTVNATSGCCAGSSALAPSSKLLWWRQLGGHGTQPFSLIHHLSSKYHCRGSRSTRSSREETREVSIVHVSRAFHSAVRTLIEYSCRVQGRPVMLGPGAVGRCGDSALGGPGDGAADPDHRSRTPYGHKTNNELKIHRRQRPPSGSAGPRRGPGPCESDRTFFSCNTIAV